MMDPGDGSWCECHGTVIGILFISNSPNRWIVCCARANSRTVVAWEGVGEMVMVYGGGDL